MTQRSIRVLVVDDHTILREALRGILDAESDLEVVAEADSARAAALASRLRPDVVLLGVAMPNDVIAHTVRRLKAAHPRTRVIGHGLPDGPGSVGFLVRLGICGYVHKGAGRHQLATMIRGVMQAGDGIMLSLPRRSALPEEPAMNDPLSEREHELLGLVARALSNRQIAVRLDIAEATVKRHLRNIFRKLGAVSRLDAVNKAVAASLIVPQQSGPPGREREPSLIS